MLRLPYSGVPELTDIVATTWYRRPTYADVIYSIRSVARMVKLVDTRESHPRAHCHAGSIPFGTNNQ